MAARKSPLASPSTDEVAVTARDAATVAPETGSDDIDRYENDFARIKRALASQPRVTIRLPEDTFVQINGYGFWIKGKEKVQVPEQVLEVLEQAGRI